MGIKLSRFVVFWTTSTIKDEKSAAKFHYIKTVSGKVVATPSPWNLASKWPVLWAAIASSSTNALKRHQAYTVLQKNEVSKSSFQSVRLSSERQDAASVVANEFRQWQLAVGTYRSFCIADTDKERVDLLTSVARSSFVGVFIRLNWLHGEATAIVGGTTDLDSLIACSTNSWVLCIILSRITVHRNANTKSTVYIKYH